MRAPLPLLLVTVALAPALAGCPPAGACAKDSDCPSGNSCVPNDDGTGTCKPFVNVSEGEGEGGEGEGEGGEGEGEGEGAGFTITSDPTQGDADPTLAVQLRWSVGDNDESSCTLSNGVDASTALPAGGGAAETLTATTAFTITCGTAFASTTVEVADLRAVRATPDAVAGDVALSLQWTGENLSNCAVTASPDNGTVVVTSNSTATAHPVVSTDFTVTCDGFDGPLTRSLHVPVVDVTVVAPDVAAGDDLPLSVSVDPAADCTVSASGLTPIESAGGTANPRTIVVPAVVAALDYTVSCTEDGTTSAVSTGVVPLRPAITFDVSSASGSTATISWDAFFATGCTLDDGSGPVQESTSDDLVLDTTTENGTVTYTLACLSGDALATPGSVSLVIVWGDADRTSAVGARVVVGNLALGDAAGAVSSLAFPTLLFVNGALSISDDPALTTVSLPALNAAGNGFEIESSPLLATVDVPVLRTVGGSFSVQNDAALTCAAIVPIFCALTTAPLDVTASDANGACALGC